MLATEDALRRFGPSKATVVDVARALGVSHAAVYRHFPSKVALREAVTRRFVGRAQGDLASLAADPAIPPPERLRAWLIALHRAKRRTSLEEPELWATFRVLAAEHSAVASDHLGVLLGQVATIVRDGRDSGDFATTDPEATARAVFEATALFHHPAHAGDWQRPGREEALNAVCDLLLDGLRANDHQRP